MNSPELCIERITLASHTSTLPIIFLRCYANSDVTNSSFQSHTGMLPVVKESHPYPFSTTSTEEPLPHDFLGILVIADLEDMFSRYCLYSCSRFLSRYCFIVVVDSNAESVCYA